MQREIRLVLFAVVVCTRMLVAAGPDRVSGSLIITVADYFAEGRSETRYFIKEASRTGRTYEVHFTGQPPNDLRTDMVVSGQGRISGTFLEDAEIVSADGRSPGSPYKLVGLPAITPVTGVQKTLVYILQTATSPASFTNAQLYNIMYAQSGISVNTFYQENSFGAVSFTGDVTGPYTITDPATCDIGNIQSSADFSAVAAGVNISAYPHRVYMIPNDMLSVCTFGGLSIIGGYPGLSWINTGAFSPSFNDWTYVVLEHELGHQLNMQHAQAIQSDGSLLEYGNNSCIMGDMAAYLVDFHVLHRMEEGWIPLSNIQQVDTSGIYTVGFGETQTSAFQAIQILPPDTTEPLYITYRQPHGLDANLLPAFTGGASIDYWNGGNNKTQLATYYPFGGALADGQTYISPNGYLRITQIAHTSNNVTVDVRLTWPIPDHR